ncbi:class I SAM-dependent methyltransferase [Empedobacter sp. UBA6745]|uniref:class I SAM-dependent methyltransferase n=1 Tax=Empedobacter sp. UBA6745 TaxID=1946447 RepID=UPI0025BA3F25|nr:class I SAM-dependent methyltransferase [Empedobacter sp. UBA6745]
MPKITTMDLQWFVKWFNSPYYHILYKNRSLTEAEDFIQKITKYLQLPQQAKVLDLACGKGRHAITLNKLGFDVLGIDLSEESIKYAKQFENEYLKFEKHDMREVYHPNEFDAVFNLFTSFGYFENYEDNFKVFEAVKQQIKSHGIFVLDYLNAEKVVSTMIPYEEKLIDGVLFKITKSVENGFIKKEIDFADKGETFHFEEFVRLIYFNDFKKIYETEGFILDKVFGNYNLDAFDEQTSDRLILVLNK